MSFGCVYTFTPFNKRAYVRCEYQKQLLRWKMKNNAEKHIKAPFATMIQKLPAFLLDKWIVRWNTMTGGEGWFQTFISMEDEMKNLSQSRRGILFYRFQMELTATFILCLFGFVLGFNFAEVCLLSVCRFGSLMEKSRRNFEMTIL